MLRSEPMKLVTVLAEKGILVRLVHVLHRLGLVQLTAVEATDHKFLKASAPHVFFPAEGYLVTLRGIKEYLQISPPPPAQTPPPSETEILVTLPERMGLLSEAVRHRREKVEALNTEEQNSQRELLALDPLADLQVPLGLLSGYDSLVCMTVLLDRDEIMPTLPFTVEEISSRSLSRSSVRMLVSQHQMPSAKAKRAIVRMFVTEKENTEALHKVLEDKGAAWINLPAILNRNQPGTQIQQLKQRLEQITAEKQVLQNELQRIAAENRVFAYAAEETLVALLAKNQGSTFFAESQYALAGRFWVPEKNLESVKTELTANFSSGVEILVDEGEEVVEHEPEGHAGHQPLNPPTQLRNNKWTRPFETLVEIFDMPSSRELDPTCLMALCFPLFFGFMVSDVGYGALITLLGLLVWKKCSANPDNRSLMDIAYCLTAGGITAFIMGLWVFADAFGIPFQYEEGVFFYWAQLIPGLPHPILIKTASESVTQMLILSVLVGWLHMGCGCIFGMINEWHHSMRHAIARLGQFLVISATAILVINLEGLRITALGAWLWNYPLGPIAPIAGSLVCWLFLGGLVLTVIGEGLMALVEFFSLFSQVISFTRLALVGVSKAAVAVAVNTMLIPATLSGKGVGIAIGLAIMLMMGHLVLLLLGALSASIQSIRLHYCETFPEFFKGGGSKFAPFGIARVYTRS